MSVYLLVYLISAAVGGPLLGAIDQHLGPQAGLFITGAVPGTVIAAVGARLALLSRAALAAAVPAHPALTGEGPCSSKVGGLPGLDAYPGDL
jgi:hypothetical protein